MADNNKTVGSLAAAKLIALIKAAMAKKYDKAGGKIEGSVEITGSLKVGMGVEVDSIIEAKNYIKSDLLVMAPIVALYDPATEESISFGVSGENAAKVTSPVSGGGTQYARLAVGTPTGDNDAATKAYVDGHAARYEVITVTSTKVSDLGYDAEEGATKYSVTFDASFDSILANLAANKPMKFNIALPDGTGSMPISFNTGYFSALNNGMFTFTGSIAGAPIVLSIGGLGSATVYIYGGYLPDPNPDDSDDGKALVVNKHKWEMKKVDVVTDVVTDVATESTNGLMSASDKSKLDGIESGANKTVVDAALDAASENPVQNKAVKAALDGKLSTSGGTLTGNLTGKYITGTWLQTTEATDLGRKPGKIAVLDESGWVYHRTPAELLADIGAATVSAMLDKAYPVGSIYMSVNSTNPKTLFGGTWVQIKDRFLLAAGTTYKAGATGGEATHKLTENEIPEHRHIIWYPNANGEQSAAIGYPEAGSKNTWYAEASKTSGAGGSAAHNNMPPYLAVYIWKRTA